MHPIIGTRKRNLSSTTDMHLSTHTRPAPLRALRAIAITVALAATLGVPAAALASSHAAARPATSPTRWYKPVGAAVNLAAAFNGTTGYLTTPSAPALEPEHTDAFTAAFWVKLASTNNNPLPRFWEKDAQYMCLMGDPTNGQYRRIGMEVQNQTLTGNTNGGATEFWGSTRLDLNTWYQVVGTFNGATGQGLIYIDGRLESMRTIYPWPAAPNNVLHTTNTQPLMIARRHQDLRYNLDGEIDSFMFWTRALSPAEVAATYAGNPPSDMAVRYEFDGDKAPNVPDSSATGAHPGLLMGGATLVPR
ncbi:MAG: LamG domain-containing protein [Solirubrobacteraceae bacterium]|jgi:hypothetical protein